MLDDILTRSRRNNLKTGITGLLCVSDQIFVQILEGGRDEVCDLYGAILKDKRHTHVRMLSYEEIETREFAGWTMGHVNAAKLNPAVVLKYFSRAEIDPFGSPGHATLALLRDLVASAAIVKRTDP
jgi:hypothetical protein